MTKRADHPNKPENIISPAEAARRASGGRQPRPKQPDEIHEKPSEPPLTNSSRVSLALEKRIRVGNASKEAYGMHKSGSSIEEIRSKLGSYELDADVVDSIIESVSELKSIEKKTDEIESKSIDNYDISKKEYLVRNSEGNYINYTEGQYKRILKSRGVCSTVEKGESVSELDKVLLHTQDRRSVVYAGPLAGWAAGVHETKEGRLLVTKSPMLVKIGDSANDWENLRRFFDTLFGSDTEQIAAFYGWMKIAVESLRNGSFRPGQALVITGKKDCGKSVCQLLITSLLGGRFARPYTYMAGKTEFNADLFTAEHLAIEDDVPSNSLADRRSFGAKIKEITANQGQRLHAKGKDAMILPVFWRMSITVNDEPENLMILPPIDESLKDKITIIKAAKGELPCDTTTIEGREKCWSILESEMPSFVAWLSQWEIPECIKSPRYGVREYQHPEILETLSALSPESKLHQIIHTSMFSGDIKLAWTGTASELEQMLVNDNNVAYEARKLFSYNTACGMYLGRLLIKHPEQYSETRYSDGRKWTIQPPDNDRLDRVFLSDKKNNIKIYANQGVYTSEYLGVDKDPVEAVIDCDDYQKRENTQNKQSDDDDQIPEEVPF